MEQEHQLGHYLDLQYIDPKTRGKSRDTSPGGGDRFPKDFSPQPARTSGHPAPIHGSLGEDLPDGALMLSQPVRDPCRSNQLGETWIPDPQKLTNKYLGHFVN